MNKSIIMREYTKIILTAAIACFLSPVVAQNTDSPYSRYGYGVLPSHATGAAKGMGGISYGVRGASANPSNPASYSSVDSLTFIFDLGVDYRQSKLSDRTTSQNDNNGGVDYVTMLFPLGKNLGMSIGLLPFSFVGYDFGANRVKENLLYSEAYTGSGGFSQVYGGVAYRPIKNLSIGANVSYLFGNTTYTRSLQLLNVTGANSEYWYHRLTMNAAKFDFGVQYTLTASPKDQITIGAVFSPKVSKTAKINRIYNIYSSSGTLVKGDTALYTGKNAYADIPMSLGLGFTWKRNDNLTAGADVTYQNWSKARYSTNLQDDMTESNRFNNSWRINAGVEYAIAPRERSFMKKIRWRGGFRYNNSYINVKNSDNQEGKYNEYGLTLGLGIPVRDVAYGRTSFINISFEYTQLKPNLSNMIKEQYYGISLGVNINELWFMKNKFR